MAPIKKECGIQTNSIEIRKKVSEEFASNECSSNDNLAVDFGTKVAQTSDRNCGNFSVAVDKDVFEKLSEALFDKEAVHGTKKIHPFFRTTNSEYGSKPPCIHTMPLTFHPKRQKFWENMARVGMYRNRGFNTALDKWEV